jgi:hypothetical protein
MKKGSKLYGIDNYKNTCPKIIEWVVLKVNPSNERLYIVINKKTGEVKNVHYKTLEYGGDFENFFSTTREEVIERFSYRINNILKNLEYEQF